MKPYQKFISPIIVIIAVLLISCSKSSNNSTCNVTYTDASPLSADAPVTYLAGIAGSASITSISYLDSAGTTTVNNPTLPFTKVVNLKKNSAATITAIGTANAGGEINISVFDEGVQGGTSCP